MGGLATHAAADLKQGDRFLAGSIAFVALRCTIQYIVLPFVLPLAGLSGGLSLGIGAVIDVIALGTIAYNVRRLWNTSWRWRYLAMAAAMVAFILFMAYRDVQQVLG